MKTLLLFCAIVISLSSFAQNGLILHYPFDGDALDYSGNNIHGTLLNGPVYTNDRFGNPNKALLFSDSAFVKSNPSSILDNLQRPFSFSTWLRIDDYDATWSAIFTKSIGSTYDSIQLRFNIRSDGSYWPDSFGCIIPGPVPPLSSWFNLTSVEDVDNIKLYIDGFLVYTAPCSDPLVLNNFQLLIGCDPPGFQEYFRGAMDEFKIFSKALSQSEINQLVSIDELTSSAISIHPNPTSDVLTISGLNEVNGLKSMEITSTTGKLVMKMEELKEEINVSELPTGIYFLNIIHEQGKETIRFVKQ